MLGQMLGGLLVTSLLGFLCVRGLMFHFFSVPPYMNTREVCSLWLLFPACVESKVLSIKTCTTILTYRMTSYDQQTVSQH